MIKFLAPALRDTLGALLRRMGTGFSAFLLSHGIPPTQVEQAILAVAVVLGVGFDVVVSLIHNRGKANAS